MWHLKFRVKHEDCVFSPLAVKYDLHIEFYPLGHYTSGDYLYTPSMHIVKGRDTDIKKYIKELKKHPRVVELEVSKIIFTLTKEKVGKETYESVYDPKVLYVTPGYNTPDGFEMWEIASWDRKPLEKVIKSFEKSKNFTNFKILRFEERNLDDIYIARLFPELPKKQKEAIELAYKSGYYFYPKKTNLDKLARIAGISKQTFQENLRKAEAKLMPLLLRT